MISYELSAFCTGETAYLLMNLSMALPSGNVMSLANKMQLQPYTFLSQPACDFVLLSVWPSYCESSLGSCDDCRQISSSVGNSVWKCVPIQCFDRHQRV